MNISFSLQHLSPDLPRRDLDSKFFVVRGADEYTPRHSKSDISISLDGTSDAIDAKKFSIYFPIGRWNKFAVKQKERN